MANFTTKAVSPTGMTGTPASPTSIGANGTSTPSFAIHTLNSPDNIARCSGIVAVIIGSSAPASSPTVQFQFSLDGTNYVNDGGAYSVPLTTSTTNYYPYQPPPEATNWQAVITNGGTNAITAWAQCDTLSVT